jgi:hypothetical protein
VASSAANLPQAAPVARESERPAQAVHRVPEGG